MGVCWQSKAMPQWIKSRTSCAMQNPMTLNVVHGSTNEWPMIGIKRPLGSQRETGQQRAPGGALKGTTNAINTYGRDTIGKTLSMERRKSSQQTSSFCTRANTKIINCLSKIPTGLTKGKGHQGGPNTPQRGPPLVPPRPLPGLQLPNKA